MDLKQGLELTYLWIGHTISLVILMYKSGKTTKKLYESGK